MAKVKVTNVLWPENNGAPYDAAFGELVGLLKLVEPQCQLQSQYMEMLTEWQKTNEQLVPWVLGMDPTDFSQLVTTLKEYSRGIGIPQGFVPHSTFWLVNNEGRMLGAVNIRHYLNDSLLQRGGHIGYGIRPSERRKGYATRMLGLALERAKTIGIEKVLITCAKTNVGSAKTIMKNGGILESETLVDGELIQKYWVDLR